VAAGVVQASKQASKKKQRSQTSRAAAIVARQPKQLHHCLVLSLRVAATSRTAREPKNAFFFSLFSPENPKRDGDKVAVLQLYFRRRSLERAIAFRKRGLVTGMCQKWTSPDLTCKRLRMRNCVRIRQKVSTVHNIRCDGQSVLGHIRQ